MIARRPETPPVTLSVAVVAMALAELTWVVLVPLVGWRLGGGWWVGAVVAVCALLTFLLMWGRWMAPRSHHRLPFEYRQMLLIVVGSILTVVGGIVGLFLASALSSVALVWAHRRHALAGASPVPVH